ncbi:hypothetical protein RJ640_025788 [Escallonia rubra]|uniref:Large ribosomal subunit protein bL12 oligomerization domain-containing protein n=1 Tax=Escallonia rubra TaxID=112253 RepID=A0AA88USE1_9ASTE|nr:hypothetical protein RJ640_025788 [Escallonia rubra]
MYAPIASATRSDGRAGCSALQMEELEGFKAFWYASKGPTRRSFEEYRCMILDNFGSRTNLQQIMKSPKTKMDPESGRRRSMDPESSRRRSMNLDHIIQCEETLGALLKKTGDRVSRVTGCILVIVGLRWKEFEYNSRWQVATRHGSNWNMWFHGRAKDMVMLRRWADSSRGGRPQQRYKLSIADLVELVEYLKDRLNITAAAFARAAIAAPGATMEAYVVVEEKTKFDVIIESWVWTVPLGTALWWWGFAQATVAAPGATVEGSAVVEGKTEFDVIIESWAWTALAPLRV